jgi:YfiH family protein
MPFDALTAPQQVHGGEVLQVEADDVGRGRDGRASAMPFVDGLITDRRAVPLILLSADCPLVCAFDPERPAVGAVHASWQGTMARASENLIRQMHRCFRSDPDRLLTAIAPSAGPGAYEVGPEVCRIAQSRFEDADAWFTPGRGDRFLFDLWSANRQQLIAAGVSPDRVEVAGLCTISDGRFWSHRREGADAGRFALFIGLM